MRTSISENNSYYLVPDDTADTPRLECTFPQWATDIGTLHSFTLTSQYTFSDDRTTMTRSSYNHLSEEATTASVSVCQKIVEELTSVAYVRMVVKVTAQWYVIIMISREKICVKQMYVPRANYRLV